MVEVTKDDADLAKLLEAIREKASVYTPITLCPSVWTHYPEWTEITDGKALEEGAFTSYSSDNITLTGENTGNA